MNTKQIFGAAFLAAFVGAQARTIDTPLLAYYVPYHYNGYPFAQTYNGQLDECDYSVNMWGVGYARSAQEAFNSCHNTTEIATRIFGKSSFRVGEAFPEGSAVASGEVSTAAAVAANTTFGGSSALLDVATIQPRLDLQERGVMFGAAVATSFGCENKWKVGLRARLPFRDIRVIHRCDSDVSGEDVDDLFARRQEIPEGQVNSLTAYAIRLDFLSSLQRIAINNLGNSEAMVQYTPQFLIAQVGAAGGLTSAQSPDATNGFPPVAFIGSSSGRLPVGVRWADYTTAIATVVGGDGSGVGDGSRGRVVTNNSYQTLGDSPSAQSRLFVVPTVRTLDGTLSPGSNTIISAIENAIQTVNNNVEDFFAEQGIDFCGGRNQGAGDLDTEFFIGREYCDGKIWGEMQIGVRFPTGKEILNCKKVLQQPLGNNGHYEIRWGGTYGWNPCDRVKFKLNSSYSWVLEHNESLSAPFTGATIKNLLPPCVCAKVSWQYLLADLDMTLFAQDMCGVDLGYSVYWKNCDKICFKDSTALDLTGVSRSLDSSVLTKNTEGIAHKIRSEIFMDLGCGEIFAGMGYTFAGKNVTRDTDIYLGLSLNY